MANERNIFGFKKKDLPDLEAEDRSPTIAFYFKLLWRKAGKLLSLNLIMDFMFFPLVAVLLIYIFGRQTVTVPNAIFAPLLGTKVLGESATGGGMLAGPLLGIFGDLQDAAFPTTGALIVMGVLILFTVVSWGFQNVGSAYNLRSLVRGDSCFLFSDYFYAIKRNWRQALAFGLKNIDVYSVK